MPSKRVRENTREGPPSPLQIQLICNQVFSHLHQKKDLNSCRLVNTQWNYLISQLHSSSLELQPVKAADFLYFNGNKHHNNQSSKSKFKKWLRNFHIFKKAQDSTQTAFLQTMKRFTFTDHPNLKSLILADMSTQQMAEFIMDDKNDGSKFKEATHTITELGLSNCSFESITSFICFLSNFPALEVFKARDCVQIFRYFAFEIASKEVAGTVREVLHRLQEDNSLKYHAGHLKALKAIYISSQHSHVLSALILSYSIFQISIRGHAKIEVLSIVLENEPILYKYNHEALDDFRVAFVGFVRIYAKTLKIVELLLQNGNEFFPLAVELQRTEAERKSLNIVFLKALWMFAFEDNISELQRLSLDCSYLSTVRADHIFDEISPIWCSRFPNIKQLNLYNLSFHPKLDLARGGQKFAVLVINEFLQICKHSCRLGFIVTNEQCAQTWKNVFGHVVMKERLMEVNIQYKPIISIASAAVDNFEGFRNLFPNGTKQAVFENVKKLQFHFRAQLYRETWQDVISIVSLFPNLSCLKICDHWYDNCEGDSALDSEELFMDLHLQIILTSLIKLKTIHIEGDLKLLTDFGLTGQLGAAVGGRLEAPHTNSNTASFSNLKELREVKLIGLGKGISDISLCHGFKNLYYLKTLHLKGCTKITRKGINKFRKNYYSNRVALEI